MLDDRPIVQKSLIGAAAFAFVFTAAMAGSAFMITGGFGLGSDAPAHQARADYVRVVQQSWDDWVPPAYAAMREAPPQESVDDEATFEPAYYVEDDLAGSNSAGFAPERIRTEADIAEDAAQQFASDLTYPYLDPQPDPELDYTAHTEDQSTNAKKPPPSYY